MSGGGEGRQGGMLRDAHRGTSCLFEDKASRSRLAVCFAELLGHFLWHREMPGDPHRPRGRAWD